MTKLGNSIIKGIGFSSDTQQLVSEACYAAGNTTLAAPQSSLNFDYTTTFSQLEEDINFSVSASGGFGMFSASASASYLRNMQDKDYSLSLNYYGISSSNIDVQFAGAGEEMLNSAGKSYYQADPYFGIICGDYVVTSYQLGAMLLMGLNLNFESEYEKEKFTSSTGASFGDIFSASSSVQKTVTSLKLKGSVSVQAFQIGGEPQLLSKILSKNSSGEYYVLTCNLDAMDNCVNAANGLLNYASQNFTSQFNFSPQEKIYPLSNMFSAQPIDLFGLQMPKSFINSTVVEARDNLANSYLENSYYQQKIYELENGYPVAFDTTSDFYKDLTKFSEIVDNNIEVLTSNSNPAMSSEACYSEPQSCIQISQNILSKVQNITSGDLAFMDTIQYKFTAYLGTTFYNNGNNGTSIETWELYTGDEKIDGRFIEQLYTVDIYGNTYNYSFQYFIDGGGSFNGFWRGKTTDGFKYQGPFCDSSSTKDCTCPSAGDCSAHTYYKEKPEFYFQLYQAPQVNVQGNFSSIIEGENPA